DYISRLGAARFDEETAGALADSRHLVARSARATGQAVLTMTTARESDATVKAAPVLMETLPGLVGVTNSYNLTSGNAILGRHHRLLAGSPEIEEVIHGVRYRVSA